ncbi:hypothetical protein BWQ96_02258 [Gracilariopsis chorda]|uniref:Multiple myeloma tumor-associated protein 2-like N-terminal domain-containing protein n=1 Tax=Gracilariopsis chorda TaxID=448386 RepID=A0A2V3J0D1_9FLOR|nr:hypothetical protein BWQ96_02258 [Gracilariopsis chorda]|eukprot:PXF47872.1 hypothetical protein BWQ96_02258 [Gracilariopsis chorda]
MDFVGDLVGAESRKNGTRGGRADFTWDSVRDDEKSYYLGNSLAKPPSSTRNASNRDPGWYNKPTSAAPQASSAPTRPSVDQLQNSLDDLQLVRQREKAIMERVLLGRSFSDAVRSALNDGDASGIDDGHNSEAAEARRVARKRRKIEKAERKEIRRRLRQERRMKREMHHQRHSARQDTQTSRLYTSDSEVEGYRSRYDDVNRRRRRRERESTMCRKRNEYSSSSDSESGRRPTRRQRLR